MVQLIRNRGSGLPTRTQPRSTNTLTHPSNFLCFFLSLIVLSFSLSCWNLSANYHFMSEQYLGSIASQQGAILPFDLSVNHLQRIPLASGALPEQVAGADEDFLPIVSKDSTPQFRFRLKTLEGASIAAIKDITAYQVRPENTSLSLLIRTLILPLYCPVVADCCSTCTRRQCYSMGFTKGFSRYYALFHCLGWQGTEHWNGGEMESNGVG